MVCARTARGRAGSQPCSTRMTSRTSLSIPTTCQCPMSRSACLPSWTAGRGSTDGRSGAGPLASVPASAAEQSAQRLAVWLHQLVRPGAEEAPGVVGRAALVVTALGEVVSVGRDRGVARRQASWLEPVGDAPECRWLLSEPLAGAVARRDRDVRGRGPVLLGGLPAVHVT